MGISDCAMMLAWTDPDPRLFYLPGKCLLAAFSCMAFLVSPLSPLRPGVRNLALVGFPSAVFIVWVLAAYFLPVHHDWDRKMTVGICGAFGLAFSLDVWRHSEGASRTYGKAMFWLFLLSFFAMTLFVDPGSS